jgi:amino acid transporter
MSHSIQFAPAILITLNIMLGSGLFMNTTELALRAGSLGFLAYIVVGLLMLPLVIGMAKLVELHPSGGFYTFAAQELYPLLGFFSAWTYFVGKLASASLMIHTAIVLIQAIFPLVAAVNTLLLDCLLITLFCMLNTLNVRIGSFIQYFFFCAKSIPIIALFVAVVSWINPASIADNFIWTGIPATLPLVLYAILGFEAACSLSSKIENARVNAPRIMLISYAIIISLSSLYQFSAYALFGDDLLKMKSFLDVFSALARILSPEGAMYLQAVLYCAIAASALGAAYGILYSNLWNLYALAQNNHTWCKSFLITMNGHCIPVACVLMEGIICCLYIGISRGAQVPLQQISAFGVVLAYTVSASALWYAVKRNAIQLSALIPFLSLANCFILSGVCCTYLLRGGSLALYLFFGLLMLGLCMAFQKKNDDVVGNN